MTNEPFNNQTLQPLYPIPEPTTEEKIDQIYRWLDELMPVARAAAKIFNARASLMKRWRG